MLVGLHLFLLLWITNNSDVACILLKAVRYSV